MSKISLPPLRGKSSFKFTHPHQPPCFPALLPVPTASIASSRAQGKAHRWRPSGRSVNAAVPTAGRIRPSSAIACTLAPHRSESAPINPTRIIPPGPHVLGSHALAATVHELFRDCEHTRFTLPGVRSHRSDQDQPTWTSRPWVSIACDCFHTRITTQGVRSHRSHHDRSHLDHVSRRQTRLLRPP
jgi:hypothetical protein